MGEINTYRLVLRTLKVTDRIENLIVDGRVVLKWIGRDWVKGLCTGFISLSMWGR